MTNIIAMVVVSIITNVTVSDNSRGCPTCEMLRKAVAEGGCMPAIYHPPHAAGEFKEATEKYTDTEIIERTKFSFEWQGKVKEFVEDKQLSKKRSTQHKMQQWSDKSAEQDITGANILTFPSGEQLILVPATTESLFGVTK